MKGGEALIGIFERNWNKERCRYAAASRLTEVFITSERLN